MKPKEKIVKDEKTYTFKMVMTEKDVKRLARAFRLLKSDAKKTSTWATMMLSDLTTQVRGQGGDVL
jgi:hypothetical protein